MNKSATFSVAFKKARDLFKEGMYRKAISKFETALTVAQDDRGIIDVRTFVINSYTRLEEVSFSEPVGLGRRAHDFCFLSISRCCVAATSWSQ